MKTFLKAFLFSLLFAVTAVAADPGLNVLVVTGGHAFEREPFLKVFSENKAIAFTHAEHGKTNATGWERGDLATFDAVVLYDMPMNIADARHPITAGLKVFPIHDEIYWGFRVGADVHLLLSTTHPKASKPLMWTRTEKKSRVVYLQLGHDHAAYENPNYRALVARSIRWVVRK